MSDNQGKESLKDKIEDKLGLGKKEGEDKGSEEQKHEGHGHKKESELKKFENYERKEEQKEGSDEIWGQEG